MSSAAEVLIPQAELLQICRRVIEGQLTPAAAYNIIKTLTVLLLSSNLYLYFTFYISLSLISQIRLMFCRKRMITFLVC